MTAADPGYLGFTLLGLVVFRGVASPRARTVTMAALNLALLLWIAGTPGLLLPMGGFLLVGFLAVHLAARHPAMAGPAALTLVGLFVALKQYDVVVGWLPGPGPGAILVGLSYMLFRVLHLVFDARDGALEPPGPVGYLAYAASFLCLFSGPVQDYQDATEDAAALPEAFPAEEREVHDALLRVALGLLKLLALCPILLGRYRYAAGLAGKVLARPSVGGAALTKAAACHAIGACGFFLYLYVNFSGYMDVVVGLGRLYGLRLPENFDHPLRCENFLDFWRRWHITVSTWFGTYLFNPLLRALMTRWPSRDLAPYLGCLAYFVTFFVLGLWHGTTVDYVATALAFGLGTSVNRLYQVRAERRLGRPGYAALKARPAYRFACRVAALAWLVASAVFMWMPAAEVVAAGRAYGVRGGVMFLLGVVAGCAVMAAGASAWARLGGAESLDDRPLAMGDHLALGAALLLVLLIWSDPQRSVPVLFYQGF